jgi:hypothetical protein
MSVIGMMQRRLVLLVEYNSVKDFWPLGSHWVEMKSRVSEAKMERRL